AQRHFAAEARHRDFVATVPQQLRPGYATSDRCEACHPSQYHSWHRGYHRTMTQYASPATVRGDFSDVELTGGGYDVRLFRRGDDFMVDMVDPLWQYEVDFGQRDPPPPGQPPPRVERAVSMVTGSHHMQAYWVPSNVGNGQLSVPFTYLFDDRRWVPRGEVFLHPPDGRHQEQVWNVSCITCHTTAGQPRALVGGKEVQSRVAEMGIACEACHGPAEEHIAANQNPFRRYWLHVRGAGDPTIVNPRRLDARRANEVCGQCHSLTDLGDDIYLGEGKSYVAGDELEKSQPLLRQLHPTPALAKHIQQDPAYLRGYFWADGTIRVSSRDYSGLVESKCNGGGKLSCISCHSLHQSDPVNLLAKDMQSDAACLQCHAAVGKDVAAHTHHRADSSGSRCYNCHMPYTVYGLLKAIRNHRIDSPHVTGRAGGNERPNACNLCHVDRSLGWTAGRLAEWYQSPAPSGLVDETPAAITWLLSGDAVLRAVAAWQFGWQASQQAAPAAASVPYLVAALGDPYAAVRYVAGHALAKIDPAAAEYDYLAAVDERRRAAEKILQRWRDKNAAAARDEAAIDARIRSLIDKRDDSPVRAME
ncbi:MAG: cytochrome c3 family protein, partial [Myxococcales bacterium]|nr:cytochrome c3 family protein [Myxococcales bacterium]